MKKTLANFIGWKITFFLSIVVVALIVSWSAGAQQSEFERGSSASEIEGTWKVRVTPPPPTGVPAFDVFMAFTDNGGLVETNNAFPPAVASPGHGAWERVGGRRYAFDYSKFLFTPQGAPNGSLRIKGTAIVTPNGNSFSSAAAVAEFYDANGNLLFSNPSPGVAARVRVQP